MKHDLRRLNKRIRRLEDKQRRDMVKLKQELVRVILNADGEPFDGWHRYHALNSPQVTVVDENSPQMTWWEAFG